MDYLSAEYVICFMVCDCDIVLLLSDQCIAGTYMGIIQIYCIYFIWNDFLTVISAFILYFITGGVLDAYLNGSQFSTYYISLSIFLAYALTYPDMKVLLYFVIPIKMKWLAILDVVLLAVDAVQGGLIIRIVIIASLLEFYYFLFLQPESAWTQSETGCPQKEISEADKPSAESICRRCKAQMCSVRTY